MLRFSTAFVGVRRRLLRLGRAACDTELVRNLGPWQGLDDLEYSALERVDWFNRRRLIHEPGRIPPAEYEADHHHGQQPRHPVAAHTNQPA